ncbi:hypothetical protein [Lentzea tibetensis]|uniref:hypothetical protein n=1 Tax=Lentzea tibetensis TaxID=2591470 RepID=UPI001F40F638|nr:hypothetical protein [Lentzea tibetensis]
MPFRLREHWWRLALLTVAVATCVWGASLFALIPILVWCASARSPRTGLVVGLILMVLLAWFVVPRELGWSGPWVPAAIEVYWLHTTLAAAVCFAGALVERRRPAGAGRLLTMVVIGFVATGFVLFAQLEEAPGDENVLPAPAQLRIAEDKACGSGGCWRVLTATGDRAPAVMREHLASRGYTPGPTSTITGNPRMCQQTGVLVTHQVCAELKDISANAVQVDWYVNS